MKKYSLLIFVIMTGLAALFINRYLTNSENSRRNYAHYLIEHKCSREFSFNGTSFTSFNCDNGHWAKEDIQDIADSGIP